MNLLSRSKIALLVLALIIAGFAWYLFSGTPTASILTTQASNSSNDVADKDIVATLLTLRTVSLSGTILSDPSFRGLNDFSTQIIPEDMGRPDPFAPLSSGVLPSAPSAVGNSELFKAVSP
mgnify:CR=1 FL=1